MKEKSTFRFYVDAEYTTWERASFEIEASSLEEAQELVKQEFNHGGLDAIRDLDELCGDIEYEDMEVMSSTGRAELISDNDGWVVLESNVGKVNETK